MGDCLLIASTRFTCSGVVLLPQGWHARCLVQMPLRLNWTGFNSIAAAVMTTITFSLGSFLLNTIICLVFNVIEFLPSI